MTTRKPRSTPPALSAGPAPPIEWPNGGFLWTDELRARLPPIRGLPSASRSAPLATMQSVGVVFVDATEMPHTPASLDALIALDNGQYDQAPKLIAALAERAGKPWVCWAGVVSEQMIQRERLLRPDPDEWLELCAQTLPLNIRIRHEADYRSLRDWHGIALDWVNDLGCSLHGLPFMVDIARRLFWLTEEQPHGAVGGAWRLLQSLRKRVVRCSDAEHDAVIATLESPASGPAAGGWLRAYLCPHRSDWALASLADPADRNKHHALRDSILPVDAVLSLMRPGWRGVDVGLLMLQVHLHGEVAMPLLAETLRSATETKDRVDALSLVLRMQMPEQLHLLAALIDLTEVRAVLAAQCRRYPAAALMALAARMLATSSRRVRAWALREALRDDDVLAQVLAAMTAPARQDFEAMLEEHGRSAHLQQLPPVLREPPDAQVQPDKQGRAQRKLPPLPDFFFALNLHPPRLLEGGLALPVEAIENLALMLMQSRLDAPHPDLAIVRQACTPDSLARFAWDLFEDWLDADAPAGHRWAFEALGLLGDDHAAQQLAPRILQWPTESAHQRALAGLDILCAIGSHGALMQLHAIASQRQLRGLRERAGQKMVALAAARGLAPAEMLYRMVPDLGLDARGTLRLSYGARDFMLDFDEALQPVLKTGQGEALKTLPKPGKADDGSLAAAAGTRYKQIKTEVRNIARQQLLRLEQAMVERQCWTAGEFNQLFLKHPLMQHLARRLVWYAHAPSGDGCSAFRIAEDRKLVDADNKSYRLNDAASISILHPLMLPAPQVAAFARVFADLGVAQPFEQLDRATFVLTTEEANGMQVRRHVDGQAPTGRLLDMERHGWLRGAAAGDGCTGLRQAMGSGSLFELSFGYSPGINGRDLDTQSRHRLQALCLRATDGRAEVRFGDLDPVRVSEVLRDMARLVAD